jgi:MscS family membrane protein
VTSVPYWQSIALPLVAVVALALGWLVARVTRLVAKKIASRTPALWDDLLVTRVQGPLSIAWAVVLVHAALPWLELHDSTRERAGSVLGAVLFVALFWMLSRAVDAAADVVSTSSVAGRAASRSLVPLAARVAKLLVVAMAVVALLSQLGYPVASLLAGLGIGGIALALAAQKTVENLFGAFSIGADRPFAEGDSVKFEDVTGTVEEIGLRSTKIRTADRSLVTVPNGRLADMRVESLSARDRMRLFCTLGLVYDTTANQLRGVLAGLEHVLRVHPKIWPENVTVRFTALGPSSLDIEVQAWFQVSADDFPLCRQEVLLRFMEVVEAAGTRFAFPTRTVHLVDKSS